MINIIKLGFKPHSCCWVHKRGQAQGLLAVYVTSCYLPPFTDRWFALSADASSGVIRLYDGRGGDQLLETIDNIHRFPVHIMTVRSLDQIPLLGTEFSVFIVQWQVRYCDIRRWGGLCGILAAAWTFWHAQKRFKALEIQERNRLVWIQKGSTPFDRYIFVCSLFFYFDRLPDTRLSLLQHA